MKAIIVDDNQSDALMLSEKLKIYTNIHIQKICKNGQEALDAIEKVVPDLIFLDIELPDMTGLEFIERLDSHTLSTCRIVVYTAYVDYMLNSFRKRAFDFLLKPINDDDLDTIVRRLMSSDVPEQQPDGRILKAENNLLLFLNTVDFRLVRLRDIGIFRYNHEKRVWETIIAGSKDPVRLKRNVSNKMLLTLGKQFVQVHQKYIINIDYLYQVTDNVCAFYPPFQDIDYVKVGAFFRRRLMNMFYSM